MSQRTACSNPVGAWFQFFHFHVNSLQPSAAGWPGSLCTAAHSQSELLKPGEAKQICMFPCNGRWAEIAAEAAAQHQEKLARAGKHSSQGVIFFGPSFIMKLDRLIFAGSAVNPPRVHGNRSLSSPFAPRKANQVDGS